MYSPILHFGTKILKYSCLKC